MIKRIFIIIVLLSVCLLIICGPFISVQAALPLQGNPPEAEQIVKPVGIGKLTKQEINPYFSIEQTYLTDGTPIDRNVINGPSDPPAVYENERSNSIKLLPSRSTLSVFPSYDWVFGCSAVSGAMIAGYYDRNGYPNMYTGPTDGGVMPLTDTSWGGWSDGYENYPLNPLVASRNTLDGRTIKGSIDDYWVKYSSNAKDPFIDNWAEHIWSDAIGDYMKTSQTAYENPDGSTSFYTFTSSSEKLTCNIMEIEGFSHIDGTYGRKLFYEARGYSVSDCYNQKTDNNGGGFSLENFQTEIDAGHPILLNLEGHSIVGYGYEDSTIFIRDTWDSEINNTYTMPWGGCLPYEYGCMELLSVSVVRPELSEPIEVPIAPTGVLASDGTFTDKIQILWDAVGDATHYKVFRNISDTHSGELELVSNHVSNTYEDLSSEQDTTYFYWVQACNSEYCSDYSLSDSGFAASEVAVPSAPLNVLASDGTFTDKVQITWDTVADATSYMVFRNISNTHEGELELASKHLASPYEDFSAAQNTTYYYWVKACNSQVCSSNSSFDSGYAASEVIVNMVYLPLVMKPPKIIINGDFEQGRNVGWTEYSNADYDLIYEVGVDWAHSGSWIAYLGGYHNAVDQLYQDVTITASEPFLNFFGNILSEDLCGYDYFYLVFGGELIGYIELCSYENASNWFHFIADMSGYVGSTETLYFIVGTDGSLYSHFFLDTVYMSASASSASDSGIFIEGAHVEFERQPLLEGEGFKQKKSIDKLHP